MPFGNISLESLMSYHQFVPRLLHFCLDLGMERGRILPSVGFCADENQGYPVLLITKHFGAYPFNHGYLGGILALDRHGPHASHADDVVIVHAPHVGFDPEHEHHGQVRRPLVSEPGKQMSGTCGKVCGVIGPYRAAYRELLQSLRIRGRGGDVVIAVSNKVLEESQHDDEDGLALHFEALLEPCALQNPVYLQSTTSVYKASESVAERFRALRGSQQQPEEWRSLEEPGLSTLITEDMFHFRRHGGLEGEAHRMERTLLPHLPAVLTSPHEPELSASLIIMQSEFERAVRSVMKEPAYGTKRLVLISGLNIDVSPAPGAADSIPETVFLPWAAYVQLPSGERYVLEQASLVAELVARPAKNEEAMDIDESMQRLFARPPSRVSFLDASTGEKQAATLL